MTAYNLISNFILKLYFFIRMIKFTPYIKKGLASHLALYNYLKVLQ